MYLYGYKLFVKTYLIRRWLDYIWSDGFLWAVFGYISKLISSKKIYRWISIYI